MAIDAKVRHCRRYDTSSRRSHCAVIDLNGSWPMKHTKRSFTVISAAVLAVPLSLSVGRLNARDADGATSTLARADR